MRTYVMGFIIALSVWTSAMAQLAGPAMTWLAAQLVVQVLPTDQPPGAAPPRVHLDSAGGVRVAPNGQTAEVIYWYGGDTVLGSNCAGSGGGGL